MNSPDLPNLETAKGMVFDEITKAINAFIADAKINNASVCLEEIEALVEVLYDKAPHVPPHPGPKPVEPALPRYITSSRAQFLPKYRRQKQDWIKTILEPWEEASRQNYQALKLTEHRIIKGIRSDIDDLLPTGRWPITRMVNWEILPPGYWPVDESSVANLFAGQSSKTLIPARLSAAKALDPIDIVIGKSEFSEYWCFRFRDNNKVLLESPYDGNAAYVLRGDWETLSKKTKRELLNIYSDFCERIIHGQSGNWKYEIKRSLGLYS